MPKLVGLSLGIVLLFSIFIGCFCRYEEESGKDVCDTMTRSERIKYIREVICKNVDSDGTSSGRTGLHTPKSIRMFIERCCNNIARCNRVMIENLEFNICEAAP